MRKLILAMQVSLDGFVEGPGGDMSWFVHDDPEHWADLFGMLQSVDLFLLGRGMWTDYRNYWKQALISSTASPDEVAYAKLAEKTKHIVFSHTLADPGWENTSISNGPVAEEVRKIKQAPGKDIQVVGGARLAATILEAGLVDEYRLSIHPAILGEGKSFFRDQHTKQSLQFVSAKTLPSGGVIARYQAK
ncbi:MAG TPA: dihydrofolate reductase family protein [Puia sp.]|nr:dihydrofolate reductase family protein [Puia sp.]